VRSGDDRSATVYASKTRDPVGCLVVEILRLLEIDVLNEVTTGAGWASHQ
jgi:hypothetical protein